MPAPGFKGPKKSLFSDDSDPGEEEVQQKPKKNLASNFTSKKHVDTAQELDSSVYDYDTVYESIHAQPKKKAAGQGPKYMQGLLDAAEIRKRDRLQAQDKLLAKEREAEGDQYADKEKFVTGAYKAQQEEVRRLAEEERQREEAAAEKKRKLGGGMTGLYKGLLDREEDRREAIAKALEEGSGTSDSAKTEEFAEEKKDAKNAGAMVNEDGQVVDKRQLLKAGLNIKPKPKEPGANDTKVEISRESQNPVLMRGNDKAKSAMRERQTRMLEAQLEQASKRAADEEDVEQEALKRAAKSRKTTDEISNAKERYLQRKKEAAAAKAAGKAP